MTDPDMYDQLAEKRDLYVEVAETLESAVNLAKRLKDKKLELCAVIDVIDYLREKIGGIESSMSYITRIEQEADKTGQPFIDI